MAPSWEVKLIRRWFDPAMCGEAPFFMLIFSPTEVIVLPIILAVARHFGLGTRGWKRHGSPPGMRSAGSPSEKSLAAQGSCSESSWQLGGQRVHGHRSSPAQGARAADLIVQFTTSFLFAAIWGPEGARGTVVHPAQGGAGSCTGS
jgi:hypothetical protein